MVATKTSAQLSFLEQAARRVDRGEAAAQPAALDPNKTGIVFVHGIGSQAPGETLLQWSEPLIDLLRTWRVQNGQDPADPVLRAEVNFSDGIGAIEVQVPPRPGSQAPRTWVFTEAWWASRVAPPSLSTMTTWLGPRGAAGRIVDGILANPEAGGPITGGAIFAARIVLVPFVTLLAALVLSIYAVIRTVTGLIPVDSIRNSAILRAFDTFLTGWFGDVRVILYDPAQSANIRAGLARSIRGLRENGCSSVVVAAHSGGVMVSFLTLTDEALEGIQIEKLITFGEGWNLAIQLSPAKPPDGSGMADRIRVDITQRQPRLRWRDFWATNDPAPSGQLRVTEMAGTPDTNRIRTGKVWNRRSLLDDHGSYWTNAEEFVIPVLQEIDVPDGWGDSSMFYPAQAPAAAPAAAPAPAVAGIPAAGADRGGAPSPLPPAWPYPGGLTPGDRASRHRQRVAGLALLRQMLIAIPVVVIAIALAWRPDRLIDIGTWAGDQIAKVPGVSNLYGPIQWLDGLDQARVWVGWPQLGFDLVATLETIGIATLQAIVLISIAQLLVSPVRAFQAWPKGSITRIVAALAEVVFAALLVVGVWAVISGDHDELLGSGADWGGGLILTLIVMAGSIGGSWLAAQIKSPAATRAFGFVSLLFFVLTMASAVVAIFRPANLPKAEIAYVVIWVGAIILFRLATARWQNWDRLEQDIAKGPVATIPVNRWPAYLAAGGFVLVVAAAALAVLFRPDELPVMATGVSPIDRIATAPGLAVIGLILFAISYAIGTGASVNRRDPIMAPDPIDSARW